MNIHQNGSTLVFSLLLLSVMSMLGLGTMQAAQLQQKMASNFRYGTAAFYAAEAGVETAIDNHTAATVVDTFSGTVGQSEFEVTVTDFTGSYQVVSTGTHASSGSQQIITMILSGDVGTTPTIDSWVADE